MFFRIFLLFSLKEVFWFPRNEWRFRAVVLRDRFDKNKNITDLVKAQQILAEAETEYNNKRHPNPLQCKLNSF
jgi:hypothetical protein